MTLEQGFLSFAAPGASGAAARSEAIFCVVRRVSPRRGTVIVCPGLGVSMSEPRYLLSELGKRLNNSGFCTIQFDYPGQGDSPPPARQGFDCYQHALGAIYEMALCCGAPITMVGYGVGNLFAAETAIRYDIAGCVLIAPRVSLWGPQAAELIRGAAYGDASELWPDCSSADELQAVWRLVVGEAIVPSQPCAPLPRSLLDEVVGRKLPIGALNGRTRVGIVSDDPADNVAADFALLDHSPTAEKPSWHWDARARETVINCALSWAALACDARAAAPSAASRSECALQLRHCDQAEQLETLEFGGAVGMLHMPLGGRSSGLCLVYEPGVPGQRVDIHACATRLAAVAVRAGHACLRYDGFGTGIADGTFETFSWSSRIAEHALALQTLRARYRYDRFIVVGNSAGARVCINSALSHDNVRGVILWGPILVEPGKRAGGGRPRRSASGALVTEYCGLWLNLQYNIDERRYDFRNELRCCAKPLLIIFAENEQNEENRADVSGIAQQLANASLQTADGVHGFSPAAMDSVIRSSVAWVEQCCR
jgi:alpha-beta hydrolase superfamily lysophospholipase